MNARADFLLRRLQSLTGVAPIGVFLLPHLTTNSSIVWGRVLATPEITEGVTPNAGVETFQHEVDFIHSLPALVILEFAVLFIPIIFHSIVGIWIASSARVNVDRYPYQSNWRYTLQRATGYVGLLYLFMHIMSLRFGWTFGGLMPAFDPHHAASSTGAHFQEATLPWLVVSVYVIGVLSLVYHFANGLWTAAITWGLTVSATAQKRWGWICAALGLALAGAGLAAIGGFATLDVESARVIEERLAQMGAGTP